METVRAVHARVQGTAPNGRPYSATDPHLLRWVHIAEVDSFLSAHRTFGAITLTADEEDRYVADVAIVAERLGADRVPHSMALRAALDEYGPELRSTRECRSAARYLAFPPGLSAPERVGYAPVFAGAVGLLPLRARILLGILPWLPLTERFVVRPATATALGLGRWSRPMPPNVVD